ncbi:MAG: SPOR domain-containing protein [Pseudomonadales bacterium]
MPGMFIVVSTPARDLHPGAPQPQVIGQSRRHGVARRPEPMRPGARSSAPRRTMAFDVPSFAIGILVGALVVVMFEFLPALLAPPPAAAVAEQSGTAAETGVQYQFQSLLTAAPIPVVTPEDNSLPVDGVAPPPTAQELLPGMTVSPEIAVSVSAAGSNAASRAMPVVSGLAAPVEGVAAADAEPVPTAVAAVEDAAPMTSPEALGEVEADQPPAAAVASTPQYAGSLQAASFPNRADAERLRAELLLLDLPADTSEFAVEGRSWYRVTVGPFPDAAAAAQARERLLERNLRAIPYDR